MDSQSTMDLFFNPELGIETFTYNSSMQLKVNGGTMLVTHKAKMAGYHKNIWSSKRAITNIIALSNIIQKYRVTYDREENMFIFRREAEGKPNMEFRIHTSPLY